MKKRQRQLLIAGIVLALLYLMRHRIRGLMQGKSGPSLGASGGGGGGGSFMGGGSPDTTTNSGVNVGPYTVPGATISETEYVDYKPPTGASAQLLPAWCISDAFTVNGVDYCIALDNRGQEVTRRI